MVYTMKARAVVLYRINRPLEIIEIEIPKLKKGQVLVKILASGICRRQLNEVKGYYGEDKYLPHLLGHEGEGEVVETGEKVTKVKKGDYAVLTWIKGKGQEESFCQYRSKGTIINAGAITTFSDYAIISENRLVKINKRIPARVGAVLGCAIPTGIGMLRHNLKVKRGSSIAIFGVGGVGASAIIGARMLGCKNIIAIDIDKGKLDFAKYLGATTTINYLKDNFDFRVDYAVEAAGKKEAMETAFRVIKDKGTTVVAGNLKKGELICLDPFDLIRGKRIVGSWGGETKPDEDISYYGKQYLAGGLKIDKLITHKFKLKQINQALKMLEGGQVLGRMVIEF